MTDLNEDPTSAPLRDLPEVRLMGDIGCAAALLFVLGISARSGPAGAVLVLLALPAFTRLLRSLAPEEHPGPWPDTAVVIACMTVPMWAVLILVFGSAGR